MIPYELIIPSAARPHLLQRVLGTLFARVDQFPQRVWIHNDERFPDRVQAIEACRAMVPDEVPVTIHHDNPPIKHGPALHWLLQQVRTDYVLYSQDDHEVVRPLPVRAALSVLENFGLHQIRFNKRDTMDKKGEFVKLEQAFGPDICCVADHWYFQTGVWRVAAIKPVVDWWATAGGAHGAFDEHCEVKINQVLNGEWRRKHPDFDQPVPCLDPDTDGAWNDPAVRARVHKTFIWGPVGEPAYVHHIGHLPEDWALERSNRDPQTVREAKGQA